MASKVFCIKPLGESWTIVISITMPYNAAELPTSSSSFDFFAAIFSH